MNEQAIPVLIAFLAIACVAAFLLRRAFTVLNGQQLKRNAEPLQASPIRNGRDANPGNARSAP
ncbi:hypothetical protein CH92_02660 [Stutzerimonas stutzeri]|uniref:Uncharacterized protein n=1 Tax=Stutzerimonas stutzeri TaxID=316 RepID=W8RZN1_STUST|nr:hypothetical protein [Stutzerimonas stutzeri]AHL77601.1 hypothetical protein CH92_02660 [Stutzerimonas stutzeri]MCQ4328417.1 hypothetical protein [Stutzerimonas stutzeri]